MEEQNAIDILRAAYATVPRGLACECGNPFCAHPHDASLQARVHLRHAIRYLEDRETYESNVLLPQIEEELKQAAMVRHFAQQREAGATKICWDL